MATMTLEQFTERTRAAWGDALHAVVLYGSAASGEYVPKRSDHNLLVLVDAIPMERLGSAWASVVEGWAKAGNPPALVMTTDEWRQSTDIFPMEYADVLERHRVLFGELPKDVAPLDREHLRLQVEREAMGKLLRLRAGTLAAGTDDGKRRELLLASFSAMMVVFRAVERVHGGTPPADAEALIRSVASRAGFSPEPFVRVAQARKTGARIDDPRGTLAGYLAGMETLVRHLNAVHA